MRIAALYDIHGNLPALEAVLDEVGRAHVDRIVVGGDVLPGPMPREALACLLDLEVPVQFIYGNGERAVLEQMAGRDPAGVPEPFREIVRWTAEQLDPDHERLLGAWPDTLRVDVPGLGEVLFCHATPRNDTEIFTRLTPDDRLRPVFDVGAALVVCGHTHMPFDRTVGTVRIVNAGSVGMPFGRTGADWLLIGPGVEFRHSGYDLVQAAERVRATAYPQAREFAEQYVLQSPSADSMLEIFSRGELEA